MYAAEIWSDCGQDRTLSPAEAGLCKVHWLCENGSEVCSAWSPFLHVAAVAEASSEPGRLQRLACVSSTGSVRMPPMAALLGRPPFTWQR
jgi:hypothetical protein